MKNFILAFFIGSLFLMTHCESDRGQEHNKGLSRLLSIFHKKIKTEFTDSTSVDSIVTSYRELERNKPQVLRFYKNRDYKLAWSEKGEFLPQADMMVNMVHNVQSHGVKPFFNHNLRNLFREIEHAKKPRKEEMIQKRTAMDILLTALYFEYAEEIWKGQFNHEDKLDWHIDRKKIQEGRALESILASNKVETDSTFFPFEPLHPEYNHLKKLLAEYVIIKNNGGWPIIHIDKNIKFKIGDTSQVTGLLKKRLYLTHDYQLPVVNNKYDNELTNALKRFQYRHGLEETGKIDEKTLHALNVPVDARIKQIIINMERWRWIPETLTPNYVWINIPEYKLHLIEDNKELWSMNVIVGRAASSTPIFNDEIEYVVFSPHWNIPEKIAMEEIVPMIRADSMFIQEEQLEIIQNNRVVNPDSVNWNNVSEEDLKQYSFRQKPGKKNALGSVKFLFPNEYDVYLHDTPTSHLFKRTDRNYSHGCIRIEDPVKFAEYLLRKDTAWNHQRIINAMNSGSEQFVKLQEREPVYIVYFTVWTDPDGIAHFRNDVYGHDKKLEDLYFHQPKVTP